MTERNIEALLVSELLTMHVSHMLQVSQKVEDTDPSATQTRAITQKIVSLCHTTHHPPGSPSSSSSLSHHKWRLQLVGLVAAGAAASWAYWTSYSTM